LPLNDSRDAPSPSQNPHAGAVWVLCECPITQCPMPIAVRVVHAFLPAPACCSHRARPHCRERERGKRGGVCMCVCVCAAANKSHSITLLSPQHLTAAVILLIRRLHCKVVYPLETEHSAATTPAPCLSPAPARSKSKQPKSQDKAGKGWATQARKEKEGTHSPFSSKFPLRQCPSDSHSPFDHPRGKTSRRQLNRAGLSRLIVVHQFDLASTATTPSPQTD